MDKTASQLQARLLAFIGGAPDDFASLALALFGFQYQHNPPYRAFCQLRGVSPGSVSDWQQIPALPTSAFKHAVIACFDPQQAVAEFHTSGTTRQQPGRHFFQSLDLYNAVVRATFPARLPVLSLVPPSPHSSLAYMLGQLGAVHLERLEPVTEPVCLAGTAFHFVNLIDGGLQYQLPPGSCVMETGGFKGRSREVTKPELYRLIQKHLAVPATRIFNEYGMTELSTQFYDQTLALGQPTNRKRIHPWTRLSAIDPQTGTEAAPGQPGLLRIHDLANLWSAACIQTEDWGLVEGQEFEILGRAVGAEPRGCSLNAEEFNDHER